MKKLDINEDTDILTYIYIFLTKFHPHYPLYPQIKNTFEALKIGYSQMILSML